MENTAKMIKITLILAGFLKTYVHNREPIPMELPVGAMVSDAMAKQDLPAKIVKLVNINGVRADFATVLQDGDQVYLQPVVLGG